MAKQYLPDSSPGSPSSSDSPDYRIHTNRWQLWTSPTQPWSTIRPQLFHHHCTMAAVRSLWIQKRSLPPNTAPDLDWTGISTAMQASPLRRCRWIVKFNSEQCGVGSTLYRWKDSDSAACPRCPHIPETTSHVLRCQGENSQVIWMRSIARLGRTLHKAGTDPEITATIIHSLHQWHSHGQPQCFSSNPSLQQAWEEQNSLGWENALRGFLSRHWRATQLLYQRSLLQDRYFSTNRWVSTLIQGLWNTAWDQWDYRNGILHSSRHAPHEALSIRLDDAITTEYQQGPCLGDPASVHLFSLPLTTLLTRPLRYRQHWLHSIEQARRAPTCNAAAPSTSYHPERRALRHWLSTGRVTMTNGD